jgi:serine phosphatase RsbU (regulator of sigma subunit)
MPEIPGYAFFSYYQSAFEIGGDYYDFIPLSRQRMAILLGDVAGKGVMAALFMAKLGADARFCMLSEPDPAAAISELNFLICQSGISEQFVTLMAAVLDPARHTVTLVNAGHPPPLIYHHAGRDVVEAMHNEVVGLPLGVLAGFEYASCEVFLNPGDILLAFTDGVTDAMNVQDLQLETKGVYAAVGPVVTQGKACSPRALVEQVVKVVKEFSSGRSQHDDIALVSFGRTGEEVPGKGSQMLVSAAGHN